MRGFIYFFFEIIVNACFGLAMIGVVRIFLFAICSLNKSVIIKNKQKNLRYGIGWFLFLVGDLFFT